MVILFSSSLSWVCIMNNTFQFSNGNTTIWLMCPKAALNGNDGSWIFFLSGSILCFVGYI